MNLSMQHGLLGDKSELGVVMSGGGARAAYQVGFLSTLARYAPDLELPIITGVSAGAINAAFLAVQEGTFSEKAERLAALWRGLTIQDVFEVGRFGLYTNVVRFGLRLMSGGRLAPVRGGMVHTAPLERTLERVLGARDGVLTGIEKNLESGALQAVALTSSSYTTGQSITWVQGRAIRHWERAGRVSRSTTLGVPHVMASAALPLFFPAVRVEDAWYGDGGMRLTAPLSPAVHLGADRILAISTRYARSREEAERPAVDGYPPPAQVAGVLMNSIFLDQFDGDALRLERINHLIAKLPMEARGDLRPIHLLVLRPSRDLGRLANEFEANLPRSFRFLTRGFGTQRTRSNDFLSLVMFQPDYLGALLDLGARDAAARLDEIRAFLDIGAAR